MDLSKVTVRPIAADEEERYQQLLEHHHYLGAIPKIGQTVRYVALYEGEWVGVLSFSAASLKCGARDRWIGWAARLQFGRLKLIANNSRFLILPQKIKCPPTTRNNSIKMNYKLLHNYMTCPSTQSDLAHRSTISKIGKDKPGEQTERHAKIANCAVFPRSTHKDP